MHAASHDGGRAAAAVAAGGGGFCARASGGLLGRTHGAEQHYDTPRLLPVRIVKMAIFMRQVSKLVSKRYLRSYKRLYCLRQRTQHMACR